MVSASACARGLMAVAALLLVGCGRASGAWLPGPGEPWLVLFRTWEYGACSPVPQRIVERLLLNGTCVRDSGTIASMAVIYADAPTTLHVLQWNNPTCKGPILYSSTYTNNVCVRTYQYIFPVKVNASSVLVGTVDYTTSDCSDPPYYAGPAFCLNNVCVNGLTCTTQGETVTYTQRSAQTDREDACTGAVSQRQWTRQRGQCSGGGQISTWADLPPVPAPAPPPAPAGNATGLSGAADPAALSSAAGPRIAPAAAVSALALLVGALAL